MKKIITMVVLVGLIFTLGTSIGFTKTEVVVFNPPAWVPNATMKALEQAFEKEHPEINIKRETVGVRKYMETVLLRGAANDLPDVFMGAPDERMDTLIDAGLAAPLDGLVEKAGLDLSPYWDSIPYRTYRRGGPLYALPIAPELRGVVNYNKDIFKESGVPFITRDTTWEEFQEMGRSLTVKDDKGRITRYGFLSKYPMLDLVYAAGEGILDDCFAPKRATFGDAGFVDIIGEFLDLAEEGVFMPLLVYKALGGSKPKIFGTGKVAGVITNCNYKGRFADLKFDWDVELIPSPSGQLEGVDGNYMSWCVSTTTENPEAAFEWMRWFVFSEKALRVKEGLLKFNKDNPPYVPELAKIWNEIAKTRKPDNWECLYEAQKHLRPFLGAYKGSGDFNKLFWAGILDVLYERKQLEHLQEAAKKCQAVLDRMYAE